MVAHYGGKKQARQLLSQSSFYSANDPRLHFGLGTAKSADLEIYWPNGLVEKFLNIIADQLIVAKEAAGLVPNAGWMKAWVIRHEACWSP